jgi:hypothetical protein
MARRADHRLESEEARLEDLEEVPSVGRHERLDLATGWHRLAAPDRLGREMDRRPERRRGIALVVGDLLQPVDRRLGTALLDHARENIEVAHRRGRRLALRPADEGRLILDPEDRRHRRQQRAAVP